MKEKVLLIKKLLVGIFTLILLSNSFAQDAPVYVVYPTDDSYVRGGDNVDANYGTDPELYVKNSETSPTNSRFVKVKFDLRGMNINSVGVAFVKLYCIRKGAEFPISVYGTGDAWDEATITYNNAPAQEDSIGVMENIVLDAWNEIDVTAYVNSQLAGTDSIISIELVDSTFNSEQIRFHSKEGATHWPILVVAESIDDITIKPPSNFTAKEVTLNSMTLVWDSTESSIPKGGYNLYNGDELLSSTTDTSIALSSLDTNAYFDFYLSAFDSLGFESEKVALTTSTLSLYNPIEDVYIQGNKVNDNFADEYLYVKDGSNVRKVLAKFDITYADIAPEDIAVAKLKLYSFKGLNSIKTVGIDDNNWTDTITWNTAPAFGDSIAQIDVIENQWNEWDITDYIKSKIATEDTISLGLYSDNSGEGRFNSVEYTDKRPKLYILTADSELPTAPTNLTGIADTLKVDLSWDESTDNVGIENYLVYNGNALLTTLEPNELTYSVTGLVAATIYQFLVQSVDFIGNISDADTLVIMTLGGVDTIAPTTPTNVTAVNISLFNADIAWTASTDNSDVAGYTIILNGDSLTSQSTSDTLSIFGLTPNTTHTVGVKAFDGAGNSSEYGTVQFKTLSPPDFDPPTKPENVTATNMGGGNVELTWDASTDNLGIVTYNVYNGSSKLANTAGLTYTIVGLTPGNQYSLAVSAIDKSGNESEKSIAEITITGINNTSYLPALVWAENRDINIRISGSEKANISIINIQGSVVYNEELGEGLHNIQTIHVPGIYFVRTMIDGNVDAYKLVIK
jgi:chitodextrinase